MADPARDPTIRRLRAEITEADRAILAAVNRRVGLVRELRAYKEERGLGFVDRAREEEIVRGLRAENPGPLSAAGLAALYERVLEVTKREAGGD